MCQCGCSELNERVKLPGPTGVAWVIEISDSCQSCGTPAGFVVVKLPDDHEMLEHIDELQLDSGGMFSAPEKAIAFVYPEKIIELCLSAIATSHGVASADDIPVESAFDESELVDLVYHHINETVYQSMNPRGEKCEP